MSRLSSAIAVAVECFAARERQVPRRSQRPRRTIRRSPAPIGKSLCTEIRDVAHGHAVAPRRRRSRDRRPTSAARRARCRRRLRRARSSRSRSARSRGCTRTRPSRRSTAARPSSRRRNRCASVRASRSFQLTAAKRILRDAFANRSPARRATEPGMAVAACTSSMVDITQYLDDCKFILVSNREPYEHMRGVQGIEVKQPRGWSRDRARSQRCAARMARGSRGAQAPPIATSPTRPGRVAVPPGEESYTLRRVWLDDADINGYYHGFANRALWPLCHMLIQHFEFRTEFWERYRTVNLRFAHAVADEAERCTGRAMAWIQDYHFALAAEFLRAMRPYAVHPSVLAHSVSAAGHSSPAPRRHARSRAARTARQRSRSSFRSTATSRTSSTASRSSSPRRASTTSIRRSRSATAPSSSARSRSASTSSGSRRWRRRPTA